MKTLKYNRILDSLPEDDAPPSGTLHLVGNKEICHFGRYGGLSSGSIICCDSFDGFPTGDVTVTDRGGCQTRINPDC